MVKAATPGPISNSRLTPVPVTQELLIYICKTEAGPTASCGCSCGRIPKYLLSTRGQGLPWAGRARGALWLGRGVTRGASAVATLSGWLISGKGIAQGTWCFAHRRGPCLPWRTFFGVYHLGFISTEGHGLMDVVSQEVRNSLKLLRDGASQHLSGARL